MFLGYCLYWDSKQKMAFEECSDQEMILVLAMPYKEGLVMPNSGWRGQEMSLAYCLFLGFETRIVSCLLRLRIAFEVKDSIEGSLGLSRSRIAAGFTQDYGGVQLAQSFEIEVL
ncbi:unnamed protein product [Dovyalis caffra]|uniref:Uncharacterized protein n=1 Tax=Dovyalis caffra TaxID=77055 RepID=A0AAV1QYS5_9ROSI|nr:unnamed protein product [Dovyalis caffra]